jgi:hypothetical protein
VCVTDECAVPVRVQREHAVAVDGHWHGVTMLCKPWNVSSCWPRKANNQATKKDGLGTWSSPAGLVRQSARAGESAA